MDGESYENQWHAFKSKFHWWHGKYNTLMGDKEVETEIDPHRYVGCQTSGMEFSIKHSQIGNWDGKVDKVDFSQNEIEEILSKGERQNELEF